MNKEELAKLLDQRDYGHEMDDHEELEAKKSGLIVIFGASDDLMEFRGAIDDELGAFDGETACLFKKNNEWNVLRHDEFYEEREKAQEYGINLRHHEIEAVFDPGDPECTWLIKSEIPHATFDIMEDGDLYCRGIVIDTKDLNH